MTTGIEWTDETWNPFTGCLRVSAGCDHCYAARDASGRLSETPAYKGLAVRGQFTGEVRYHPDRLTQPIRWRRPRRVFVNSMSDLFYAKIDVENVVDVFAVMALAAHHQFQVLTKRPGHMQSLLARPEFRSSVSRRIDEIAVENRVLVPLSVDWPIPNVWLGTSIETDRWAGRANALRETPAAVRFLSLEPLLEPLPSLDLTGIDWVIVGGESGPGARTMHPAWVRDLRDRCSAEGVPFLFKQWGEYAYAAVVDDPTMYGNRSFTHPGGGRSSPIIRTRGRSGTMRGGSTRLMEPGDETRRTIMLDDDTVAIRVGKRTAGRTLDGRTHDEYPEGR